LNIKFKKKHPTAPNCKSNKEAKENALVSLSVPYNVRPGDGPIYDKL
jgi:hypothetical protein